MSGSELPRQANRAGDVDAAGAAQREAFAANHVVDQRHRLLVGDLVGHVDRRTLEVIGDARIPDALTDGTALDPELAVLVVVV